MLASLLLLAQGAAAAEVGALLKSDRVYLEAGGSATATVLLWGGGEVSLSAKAPDGILVLFQPESVDASSGSERVASGAGYVAASPAKALVKDLGAGPGEYVVPIVARAAPSGGDLSFAPSVALSLRVHVEGDGSAVSVGPERVIVYGSSPAQEKPAQEKPAQEAPILLYLAAAVSILAVSCIIYRYA